MISPVWIPEAIRSHADAESGAVVEQLTSEPVTSTNIYCEQRYASADGMRIALTRKPFGRPTELWVCDLRSLSLCRAAEGEPLGANASRNAVYYVTGREGRARLMRLDLISLETHELHTFEGAPPRNGAVSPDERWLVGGPFPAGETRYSLRRVSLADGHTATLCEIEDMVNPHLQFEPIQGRELLVQVNRGYRRNQSTGVTTLAGPLGSTLCLVEAETGTVTSLPVGRPHTPPISGHECWRGPTGRVLFTAGRYVVSPSAYVTLGEPKPGEPDAPGAAIFEVARGDTVARVVAQGLLFNHLAVSDDGRFFIADDHRTCRIYIGNIATGRYRHLCETHTRQGKCQYSHAHAYMTPDNRYVIFNSVMTGVAQVYAARVPDGFLDAVLAL